MASIPIHAGVVLAAGYSSRMGAFKPLLPLGPRTVVATAVRALTDAGVTEVVVVSGYGAARLRSEIERLGAVEAHNAGFDRGMYSSVQAGVTALSRDVEAFFLLPCDVPLAGAQTVRLLAEARRSSGDPDVCYPVHAGRRGHPPLISSRLIPEILAGEPDGGLRALLAAHDAIHVPTPVRGAVMDLDTPEAYEALLAELEASGGGGGSG
jgi:molybdenum cofactor cytidylyltransferase